MPLDNYGVLVGSLDTHYRDRPDTQGRWYHVNLMAKAPLGQYRCAVDVDSKASAVGVQWKLLTVPAEMLGVVPTLEPGYTELESEESTGALDHIRHPALANFSGCVFVRTPPPWLQGLLDRLAAQRAWISGSNLDAATALESTLTIGARTLAFGEPFSNGLGMHNIHQNQGDPTGSQWWSENGIWQDGAIMTLRPDGAFEVFISKFSSQSSSTDDEGHPI
jgi:hypothetical protein